VTRRIGVLGGSFSPVHEGHLRLAECALEEFGLERVIFVPAYQAPLRPTRPSLGVGFRLRLLRLALKGHKRFSISLCEIRRKGVSYTVETLRYFRKKFGAKTVLYFLTGMDALASLPRWKRRNEIFKLCRFVVAERPGYARPRTKDPVVFLPMDPMPVSSSEIRDRIKAGRSIAGLVPKSVEKVLGRINLTDNEEGL